MKKCPICNQIFSDDNDFCTNDGTTLIMESGQVGFVGFSTSGEMPTQYIPRPNQGFSPAAPNSSILYLVIGVLATALVGVGLYLFLTRDSGKRTDDENANLSKATSAASTQSSPGPGVGATPAADRTPGPTVSGSTVAPIASPSGRWQGQWTNGKGSAFGQQLTLTDEGNGRVTGQVVHTLQQTINPQKTGKIGLTAVEYVQGTYDPNTRIIVLSGTRKSDPNGLIILDKYRLSISADNAVIAGETVGGKSRGQIRLRR